MSEKPKVAPPIAKLLNDINRERRLRVWSIVVTVFGDCIAPRQGEITLSSLQRIFSLFMVEPNALRTALSRLASDGWLERNRHGRQTSYCLKEEGAEHFRSATDRIYATGPSDWSGEFELLIQTESSKRLRYRQHDELVASGFGSPVNGVYIRPSKMGSKATDNSTLSNMVASMRGDSSPVDLIASAWPIDELNKSYRNLEERFAILKTLIADGHEFSPQDCLVARVLLIHEWRRVLLKDVDIPAGYKPADWRGEAARGLVSSLYESLLPKSESLLDELEAKPGILLPGSGDSLEKRFKK